MMTVDHKRINATGITIAAMGVVAAIIGLVLGGYPIYALGGVALSAPCFLASLPVADDGCLQSGGPAGAEGNQQVNDPLDLEAGN